jgi:hypothetical protein
MESRKEKWKAPSKGHFEWNNNPIKIGIEPKPHEPCFAFLSIWCAPSSSFQFSFEDPQLQK